MRGIIVFAMLPALCYSFGMAGGFRGRPVTAAATALPSGRVMTPVLMARQPPKRAAAATNAAAAKKKAAAAAQAKKTEAEQKAESGKENVSKKENHNSSNLPLKRRKLF